jgi:predicted aconitase with swiveling domain
MAQSRQVFDPLVAGDVDTLPFDFTSRLQAGETISTAVVTSSVYTGVDPNAATMINGAAVISGTVVNQSIATAPNVIGGLIGVIYFLICKITTSLGQVLQQTGYLSVIPPVP